MRAKHWYRLSLLESEPMMVNFGKTYNGRWRLRSDSNELYKSALSGPKISCAFFNVSSRVCRCALSSLMFRKNCENCSYASLARACRKNSLPSTLGELSTFEPAPAPAVQGAWRSGDLAPEAAAGTDAGVEEIPYRGGV